MANLKTIPLENIKRMLIGKTLYHSTSQQTFVIKDIRYEPRYDMNCNGSIKHYTITFAAPYEKTAIVISITEMLHLCKYKVADLCYMSNGTISYL